MRVAIILLGWMLLLSACTPRYVSGLRPIEPDPHSTRVDSLQPTLRWETFPPSDLQDPRLELARDITYEIRVYHHSDDLARTPVYSRSGILKPEHRLQEPLRPASEYLWTVRASFRLHGELRRTQWSGFSLKPERLAVIPRPAKSFYRLRTPKTPASR